MKKSILIFLFCILPCIPSVAAAVDYKLGGLYQIGFDLGQGGAFNADAAGYNNQQDNFEATQRVRVWGSIRASDDVSAFILLKLTGEPDRVWGKKGFDLGGDFDGSMLMQAYIDWKVPSTDLKIRIGRQTVQWPSFTGQNLQWDNPVDGVTTSYRFNDTIALTALWLRYFNDHYMVEKEAGLYDNADIFGLVMPFTYEGVNITPWAAYGMVGKNVYVQDFSYNNTFLKPELKNAQKRINDNDVTSYGSLIMGGITGEIRFADPWYFAWDAQYAGIFTGDEKYNRGGYSLAATAQYRLGWLTPALNLWYTSGEDDDLSNGSERLFSLARKGMLGTNDFSRFAFYGQEVVRSGTLGATMVGTAGIGLSFDDISVIENVKHSLRVNYIQGTNAKEACALPSQTQMDFMLSTKESAVELGLFTKWQVYQNLSIEIDAAYLAMNTQDYAFRKGLSISDAWNISTNFVYLF